MASQKKPNKYLSLILWLMPSCGFKRWALRRLGNRIADNVIVGPTVVLGCGPFSLADGAAILNFNVFRNLSYIRLDRKAFIGSWNQFTAAPEYQAYSDRVGMLLLKELSGITNRHYIDCSGQVILQPYAGVGGIKSIIQSHEIDLTDNKTTLGRVVFGENAMSGTACVILKDSYLPERSVLAAGSVLVKAKKGTQLPTAGLYGGAPARFIREVKDFTWWRRDSHYTPVTAFDDSDFALDDDQVQLG